MALVFGRPWYSFQQVYTWDDIRNAGVNAYGYFVRDAQGRSVYLFQGSWGAEWVNASQFDARLIADGGDGNDIFVGTRFWDSIAGGSGNDLLQGFGGNDTLSGGDGNDVIVAGRAWNDAYYGDDTRRIAVAEGDTSTGNTVLSGGDGNDVIVDGAGNGNLRGGNGDDRLYGGAGNDFIDGGDGNDTVFGGSGVDSIIGGNGDDYIDIGGYGPLVSSQGVINDPAYKGDAAFGGAGNDHIVADGWGAGVLAGDDGNDWIEVRNAYKATVWGGRGNDLIDASANNVGSDITGGEGNDTILGSTSNDTIDGGAGIDIIRLGKGDDVALVYTRDGGGDFIEADDGYDTLNIDFSSAADLAANIDTFRNWLQPYFNGLGANQSASGTFAGVTFRNFEYINISFRGVWIDGAGSAPSWWVPPPSGYAPPSSSPTSGSDSISVWRVGDDPSSNWQTFDDGMDGDDLMIMASKAEFVSNFDDGHLFKGGGGDDTLIGQDRRDNLDGGTGSDALFGGDGDDTLTAGAGWGNDTLSGQYGNDVLDGRGTASVYAEGGGGYDTLFGSDGDDSLDGGTGNDQIFTGDGNDTVLGGNENDFLYADGNNSGNKSFDGGRGDDTVYGGKGDDTITGGAGNDWVSAGRGNDLLLGGDGDDNLGGSDGTDTLLGGAGRDTLDGGTGDDLLMFSRDTTWDGYWVTWRGANSKDYAVDLAGFGRSLDLYDGGSGRDTLQGSAGRDAIIAVNPEVGGPNLLANVDHVSAGSGGDVVDLSRYHADGGRGVEIYGGNGGDVIIGSVSNDLIVGGYDNDSLIGNGGADRFVFSAWNNEGCDVIYDFNGSDRLIVADPNAVIDETLTLDSNFNQYDLGLKNIRDYFVANAADNTSGDAVIYLKSGTQITVAGLSVGDLYRMGALAA
jgi:Ca2+-binding RTX toxin-like protein